MTKVTNNGLSDSPDEAQKVLIGTEYTGTSLLMSHTQPENLTAYNEFPVPEVKRAETTSL